MNTISPKIEILSITVNTPITACLNGIPIKTPHWQPRLHLPDGVLGSRRAAVFPINAQTSHSLSLQLKISNLEPKQTFILTGKYQHFIFEAHLESQESPQTSSTYSLNATLLTPITSFTRMCGSLQWFLSTTQTPNSSLTGTTPFLETFLELFWIYNEPGPMYTKGVWIEVLRLLSSIGPGLNSEQEWIQRIVNYCHAGNDRLYDSAAGASHFGLGYFGGAFQLKKFLSSAEPLCNCYDQAGAVQTLLGAIGLPVTWLRLQPFGFLAPGRLIGRGYLNNPFFLKNPPHSELVPTNSNQRSGFGSHAFCLHTESPMTSFILDSCFGPQPGLLSPSDYLKESIDYKTNLYGTINYLPHPGTLDDICDCGGITRVSGITSEKDEKLHGCSKNPTSLMWQQDFKQTIGYNDLLNTTKNTPAGVVFDWNTLRTCPILQNDGWKISYYHTIMDIDTGHVELYLNKNKQRLHIEIIVNNQGPEQALGFFMVRALAHTCTEFPFDAITRHPETGFVCSEKERPAQLHITCSFLNITMCLNLYHSDYDVLPLKQWLQNEIQKNIKENLPDYLPQIQEVKYSNAQISVGQKLDLTIITKPGNEPLLLDFNPQGNSLRLLSQQKKGFSFIAKQPGQTTLHLIATNKRTLLTSPVYPVEITVK